MEPHTIPTQPVKYTPHFPGRPEQTGTKSLRKINRRELKIMKILPVSFYDFGELGKVCYDLLFTSVQ